MASRKRTKGALVKGGRRAGGAPLENLFGQIFDPVQKIGARLVIGKQVDDVVTEAVKEAYAAGVAAALEAVRSHMFATSVDHMSRPPAAGDSRCVKAAGLADELDAIFARLAEWKVPRA